MTTTTTTTKLSSSKGKRGGGAVVTACVMILGFLAAVGVIAGLAGSGTLSSKSFSDARCTDPCVPGSEDIMSQKGHGTSEYPVQENLRWGCDWDTADRICNFNRHYAEYSGYWATTSFLSETEGNGTTAAAITFYDSGWKGRPLFIAPSGRSLDDFVTESKKHGWPSFRDSEVDWDNVRVLPGGEVVSIDGTHLGHNLPDSSGNRYCINLVSIAGNPASN